MVEEPFKVKGSDLEHNGLSKSLNSPNNANIVNLLLIGNF